MFQLKSLRRLFCHLTRTTRLCVVVFAAIAVALIYLRSSYTTFHTTAAAAQQELQATIFDPRTPPIDPNRSSRPLTIFCYALVGKPLPATTALLLAALHTTCTKVTLFGSFNDPTLVAVKAYDQPEWPLHFYTNLLQPMRFIYRYLSRQPVKYDWYVKLDTDTWVNPYTFHDIFDQPMYSSPQTKAYVLSTMSDGNHGQTFATMNAPVLPQHNSNKRNQWGSGTRIDGFFVAHSHASIQEILPQLLQTSDVQQSRCVAQFLSGHSEDDPHQDFGYVGKNDPNRIKNLHIFKRHQLTDNDDEACRNWMTQRGTHFPLDHHGYAMMSPLDLVPTVAWLKEMYTKQTSRCVTKWNEKDPAMAASMLDCDPIQDPFCDDLFAQLDQSSDELERRGQNRQANEHRERAMHMSDVALVRTPRGNQCFSHRLALIHAVRELKHYRQYTEVAAQLLKH
jgi:hypothetical protein